MLRAILRAMTNKQWKPSTITWYYVSDMGDLKRSRGSKQINGSMNASGYLKTSIGGRSYLIHRLVAEVWIRPIRPGETVHHMNFNRTDNRVENLEIVTHGENVRIGHAAGRYAACSKLDAQAVERLRAEYEGGGVTQSQLARIYGVSQTTVSDITSGRKRVACIGR